MDIITVYAMNFLLLILEVGLFLCRKQYIQGR